MLENAMRGRMYREKSHAQEQQTNLILDEHNRNI